MRRHQPLGREDFASTTWQRLAQELQDRLDALRAFNDMPAIEGVTAQTRGRIAELKRILDLATASSKQGASPNTLLDQMPGE
jgi:hypothetical protein